LALICFVFPFFEEPIQPYYGLYYGVMYFSQGITTYVLSIILKNKYNRTRPTCDRTLYRIVDLRGKVECASWPSGDSMQSATFACFMLFNMHRFIAATGTRLFFMSIPIQTAFARMFFQCHYLGDVVAGLALGTIVSLSNSWLGFTLIGWFVLMYWLSL